MFLSVNDVDYICLEDKYYCKYCGKEFNPNESHKGFGVVEGICGCEKSKEIDRLRESKIILQAKFELDLMKIQEEIDKIRFAIHPDVLELKYQRDLKELNRMYNRE